MGYAGKLEEKQKAIALRKQGLSYGEILKQVKVSKDTISRWCRDVKLTKKQLERLYLNRKTGNLKGSIIAAKNKQRRRVEETARLMKEGISEIGKLTKRDFFISGLMLYCGEGNKTDGSIGFSNSDPDLMKFMVRWFRKFCKPGEGKLKAHLYLHDNLSEKGSKRFWSDLLDIPLWDFYKTYIVQNNPNRFRKVKNKYGVLQVGFASVKMHRKLMGWIKGVLK